jgi:hypothetical protein
LAFGKTHEKGSVFKSTIFSYGMAKKKEVECIDTIDLKSMELQDNFQSMLYRDPSIHWPYPTVFSNPYLPRLTEI